MTDATEARLEQIVTLSRAVESHVGDRIRDLAERALADERAHATEQAAQIAALTEQRDTAEDRQLERGAELSELHGALAEKDAQIAALRTLLNYALNGWGAHARKDMEHEEIGRIRREALRETPAPEQEPT